MASMRRGSSSASRAALPSCGHVMRMRSTGSSLVAKCGGRGGWNVASAIGVRISGEYCEIYRAECKILQCVYRQNERITHFGSFGRWRIAFSDSVMVRNRSARDGACVGGA